jgi:hypothetical protein
MGMTEFENDCNREIFGKIFGNSKKIKEIHIDTYVDKPFMLLARMDEKNVMVFTGNRITIHKNDRYKTIILNILLEEISDCMFKKYTDNQYEILFNVRNICYKILVII